ncbi:MAG: AtpZ/AtpI family protein [Devosia sp.]
MANPRDTKRPESGSDGTSPTGDLAARIARARGERPAAVQPAEGDGTSMSGASRAYRLAAEFVAAIIVGAGIGYGIDLVAGTKPWAMIVFLLLGFAAGVLNVVRATAEMNAATAVPPGTQAMPDDDDE